MQLAYFPMVALLPTGSEAATSHIGSFNMDFSYGPNQWVYAPFDCKVRNIYHSSRANANTTWFESIEPVKGPKFTDYQTFFLSHMYNADFEAFGLEAAWKSGKVFKQGEKIYKAGMQGNATGVHIHVSWGRGKFTGTGWHQIGTTGVWCINNNVHIYDAVFLKTGTPHIVKNNPADKYPWVWEPKYVFANMVAVANKAVDTKSTVVRVRDNPGLNGTQISTLPLNSRIKITAKSAAPCDGYDWIKVEFNGVVGYSAVIANSMTLVDVTPPTISIVVDEITEYNASFTWAADMVCDSLQASLDGVAWNLELQDVESWNKKKIVGLLPNTLYKVQFRAKSTAQIWGYQTIEIQTKVVDPTAELKKELAIANSTIAAQKTIIKTNEDLIAEKESEIKSFIVINEPIYTKAQEIK